MKIPLKFIKSQKLLTIASHNDQEIWIANVYFSADDKGNIYFISSKDSRHSKLILKNPDIAFSIAWFDPKNHKNRKSIQGLAHCRPAKTPGEIATAIKLQYENFPDLRDMLTIKWIMNNAWGAKVWVLKPSYMKYFDDELYGEEGSEEFNLK